MTGYSDPVDESDIVTMTGFRRDMLRCIALNGTGSGVSIKAWLEDNGYGELNHGRLYSNLDRLTQQGYVSKSSGDSRKNKYGLTLRGAEVVNRQRRSWDAAHTAAVKRGDTL